MDTPKKYRFIPHRMKQNEYHRGEFTGLVYAYAYTINPSFSFKHRWVKGINKLGECVNVCEVECTAKQYNGLKKYIRQIMLGDVFEE